MSCQRAQTHAATLLRSVSGIGASIRSKQLSGMVPTDMPSGTWVPLSGRPIGRARPPSDRPAGRVAGWLDWLDWVADRWLALAGWQWLAGFLAALAGWLPDTTSYM